MSRFSAKNILLYASVFIAFLFAINTENAFWLLNPDKCGQLIAAQSLVDGEGYTTCQVTSEDLAVKKCTFLLGFPPGYSIIAAGLHLFTDNHYIIDRIFNLLSLLLYFSGLFILLRMIKLKPLYMALFFFWHAISNSLIQTLGSTDLLSLALLIWAFIVTLRLFKLPTKWELAVLVGLIMGFNCVVKYSYYPMIVAIPIALIISGFMQKNKRLYISAGLVLSISVAVLAIQTLYIKANSGSTAHVSYNSEDGNTKQKLFYFDNLNKIKPFPAYALLKEPFNFHIIPDKLAQLGIKFPLTIQGIILFGISGIIFLLIFYTHYIQIRELSWDNIKLHFGILAVVTIFVNAGSIKSLSLLIPPLASFGDWTYVQEYRYFAPAMLCCILMLMLSVDQLKEYSLKYVGFVLLLAGLLYPLPDKLYKTLSYGLASNTFDASTLKEVRITGTDKIDFKAFHEAFNSENGQVVFSQNGFISDIYALEGAIVCRQYQDIINGNYKTSQPVTVVLRIPDMTTMEEVEFIGRHDAIPIVRLENETLYKATLN